MTLRVKKRGVTYRLEGRLGERAQRGAGERDRIRLSLGTGNGDAAQICLGKIERALAEGPTSLLWKELGNLLPPETFAKLAGIAKYQPKPDATRHTWQDLSAKFKAYMVQRVALDKMRDSTRSRYEQTCKAFGDFLRSRAILTLDDISRAIVEDFKAWQLARVTKKKFSRGGRGVIWIRPSCTAFSVMPSNVKCSSRIPFAWKVARETQPIAALSRSSPRSWQNCETLPAVTCSRFCCYGGPDCVGRMWSDCGGKRLTGKRERSTA